MSSSKALPSPHVLQSMLASVSSASGSRGCEMVRDGEVVARVGEGLALQPSLSVKLSWAGSSATVTVLDQSRRALTPEERAGLVASASTLQAFLRAEDGILREDVRIGAKLEAALEYLTDAVILISGTGLIEFVNAAFERVTQKSRDQMVGHPYWESFPGVIGTRFDSDSRKALSTGKPQVYEEFSERLGKWFECRAFPCHEGVIVLLMDVTARKADEKTRQDLEEKLLRAQRMESLGTLAGGIAHDFNNILAAILGHAGMVAQDAPPGSELRGHMDQIQRAGARARELVQRILVYARGGAHELSGQPLMPLVKESVEILRATLPPSVKLEVDLSEEVCAATVNPSEVQQVVLNLCTNAWQAMPGGQGVIRMALRCVTFDAPRGCTLGRVAPTKYAEICVEDDGSGIDDDVKQRLFEPFFTTKPCGQGTGLGLHVLHEIVDAHSGAIDVVSRPGRGTRFSVYLPVVEAEGPVMAQAISQALNPGNGERIAYVDDDPIVLMMVERLLEKAGFHVVTFAAPERLLERLMENRYAFELIVTDYNMPDMNGIELAEAVRALNAALPVVVTTGYVSEEVQEAAERLGNMAVLQKERSYEELAELAALAIRGFPENRFGDAGLSTL